MLFFIQLYQMLGFGCWAARCIGLCVCFLRVCAVPGVLCACVHWLVAWTTGGSSNCQGLLSCVRRVCAVASRRFRAIDILLSRNREVILTLVPWPGSSNAEFSVAREVRRREFREIQEGIWMSCNSQWMDGREAIGGASSAWLFRFWLKISTPRIPHIRRQRKHTTHCPAANTKHNFDSYTRNTIRKIAIDSLFCLCRYL